MKKFALNTTCISESKSSSPGSSIAQTKIFFFFPIDFSKAMKSIKLPTYIESLKSEKDQRIMVRPSDFLYFPRVAKTGSNFIINLLLHLDDKNEFVVVNFAKDNEVIWDVLPGILNATFINVFGNFLYFQFKFFFSISKIINFFRKI